MQLPLLQQQGLVPAGLLCCLLALQSQMALWLCRLTSTLLQSLQQCQHHPHQHLLPPLQPDWHKQQRVLLVKEGRGQVEKQLQEAVGEGHLWALPPLACCPCTLAC